MGESIRSRSRSRVAEAVAVVPVEEIPVEGLSGTHISRHLARFYLKVTSIELHFIFLHRVKLRGGYMQKPFVHDLNSYLET